MLSRGRVNGGAVSGEVRRRLVVPTVSNNDEVLENHNNGADYPGTVRINVFKIYR